MCDTVGTPSESLSKEEIDECFSWGSSPLPQPSPLPPSLPLHTESELYRILRAGSSSIDTTRLRTRADPWCRIANV